MATPNELASLRKKKEAQIANLEGVLGVLRDDLEHLNAVEKMLNGKSEPAKTASAELWAILGPTEVILKALSKDQTKSLSINEILEMSAKYGQRFVGLKNPRNSVGVAAYALEKKRRITKHKSGKDGIVKYRLK